MSISARRHAAFLYMAEHHSLGVVRALWNDLLRGALKVVATPGGNGYELLLAPTDPPPSSPYLTRRAACFEAVVRGTPQKAVGAELNLAAATVAGMMRASLGDMGVSGSASRMPIALPLLAHAAHSAQVVALCEVNNERDPQPYWLLSLSAPTPALVGSLSEAERQVVSRYIAGDSHITIASARNASKRTVANQLASAFRKLGATCRFGLIRALFEESARLGAPVTLTLVAKSPDPTFAPAPASRELPQRPLSDAPAPFALYASRG
jgi:DNA-binding CsgD family transcriptional regulator